MKGLLDICKLILKNAIFMCPVDTQSLARSGKIKHVSNGVFRVQFGDGVVEGESHYPGRKEGDQIDYALYVHEDESLNHPRGGTAKFLENAALEVMNTCIADRIPCGMNLLLGFPDGGSDNCIAVEVFDPNIVKESMVSGIPLGCSHGVNNNVDGKNSRGWRHRIGSVIKKLIDSLLGKLEAFGR